MTTARRVNATPSASGTASHQSTWTRLSSQMGYTNTAAKRAVIRAGIEQMTWVEPTLLAPLLDAWPLRYYVGGLFACRQALHRAAAVDLPADSGLPDGPDLALRLIGLSSVTGERHVLLDLGYQVIDVLHETVREESRP
jgi:hypothetical protein